MEKPRALSRYIQQETRAAQNYFLTQTITSNTTCQDEIEQFFVQIYGNEDGDKIIAWIKDYTEVLQKQATLQIELDKLAKTHKTLSKCFPAHFNVCGTTEVSRNLHQAENFLSIGKNILWAYLTKVSRVVSFLDRYSAILCQVAIPVAYETNDKLKDFLSTVQKSYGLILDFALAQSYIKLQYSVDTEYKLYNVGVLPLWENSLFSNWQRDTLYQYKPEE